MADRMLKKFFILLLCFFPVLNISAGNKFVLVIDPGHGGKDIGAPARNLKSHEKDINLKVGLAFGKYVERNCPDVKVIYTRKTDVFIPLNERANIANRNKADLFISIHTNSLAKGRTAKGLETYTLGMHRAEDNLEVAMRENSVILVEDDYKKTYAGFDPRSSESYIMFEFMQDNNMSQSVDLAKMVQREVCAAAHRPNRGVHQAGFLVLRCTMMPSCLIELGFISTPSEESMMNNNGELDKMARGIYNAFVSYRKKYDKHGQTAKIIKIDDAPAVQETTPTMAETRTRAVVEEEKVEEKKETIVEEPRKTISDSELVFKVQIMAGVKISKGDRAFKGLDADCYEENGINKYTVGCSSDYNEIYRLRKSVLDKFPQAFIVAFRGSEKVNIRQAIQEFKNNRNRH